MDSLDKLAQAEHKGMLKPGSLVYTIRWVGPQGQMQKKPLMMEFAVPQTEPYLVTSSRALMWIPQARNGRVRAAIRRIESTAGLFMEIVRETARQGSLSEWGNVHPLTKEGIQSAIDHVKFYDLTELHILAHPDTDWSVINPEWKLGEDKMLGALLDIPVEQAPWLDPRYVLVVPRDRGFIGFAIEIGDEHAVSVIHNASRGIGIATSVSEPEPDEPVA